VGSDTGAIMTSPPNAGGRRIVVQNHHDVSANQAGLGRRL
jgi:hypothetical protein